jgi:hypothetical protein
VMYGTVRNTHGGANIRQTFGTGSSGKFSSGVRIL